MRSRLLNLGDRSAGTSPVATSPLPGLARATIATVPLLIACLLMASAASANRARVTSLERVSGKTPFPDACGTDWPIAPNSEVQPAIAAGSAKRRKVVIAFEQDRILPPEQGGALSNVVVSSRDGGKSWERQIPPKLTRCSGGRLAGANKPAVDVGPDGRVYMASTVFNASDEPGFISGSSDVVAARSNLRSTTLSAPRLIVSGEIDDRAMVAADPSRPGTAYVTWERHHPFLVHSPQYVSRTTDGGRTWSKPRQITVLNPGHNHKARLSVRPNGTVLVAYIETNPTAIFDLGDPRQQPFTIWAQRSRDRGRTWTKPVQVAETPGIYPKDPESGAAIRALTDISLATARGRRAFVVWNDIESEDSSRILLARSRNGGRGWSKPRVVAKVDSQAVLPSVAALSKRTIGVTFDDFRRDRPHDGQLRTDVWFRHSHDGGRTWREKHLAGSFDMLTAPEAQRAGIQAHYLGDYQDLTALRRGFGAVFAQAKPSAKRGSADVYFARVRLKSRR